VFGVGCRLEANPFVVLQGHRVTNPCRTEVKFALNLPGSPGKDHAALKARQKQGGLINPVHQTSPDLLATEDLGERVRGIVDLDEVFKTQKLLPKSAAECSGSLARSSA